jgi:hypothetical protein
VGGVASIEIDTAPILRTPLDSGAGRPGETGAVDVLATGGFGLVAVVDQEVEAQPTRRSCLADHGLPGDRSEDAVALRGAPGGQAYAGCGGFQGALPGIGVAGCADVACGVEGEDSQLEAAGGVLGAGGWVEADLDGIAAPMPADVVGLDVGDDHVVQHLDVDPEAVVVVEESGVCGAVGRGIRTSLPGPVGPDVDADGIPPGGVFGVEARRLDGARNPGEGHRVQSGPGAQDVALHPGRGLDLRIRECVGGGLDMEGAGPGVRVRVGIVEDGCGPGRCDAERQGIPETRGNPRGDFQVDGGGFAGDDRDVGREVRGEVADALGGGPCQVVADGGSRAEGKGCGRRGGRERHDPDRFGCGKVFEKVGAPGARGDHGLDQGERLGATQPRGVGEPSETLGAVMAEGVAGDVGGGLSVDEGFGGGHRGDGVSAGAGEEEFAGLPGGEAFLAELLGERFRVGGGREGLGGEDAGRLVMSVLARVGGGVEGDDDLGAEGPDQSDEAAEGIGPVPFPQGGGVAFGVEEVLLFQEVAGADAEEAEAVAEFGFAEDSEGGTPVGSDHVAAAFTAGDVGVGDGFALAAAVAGEGGGHAGFVVGMGEDPEDIGFRSAAPWGAMLAAREVGDGRARRVTARARWRASAGTGARMGMGRMERWGEGG